MKSLTQSVLDYQLKYVGNSGCFSEEAQDVLCAATRHIGSSHITRTFPDGSSGKKEVTWSAADQQFSDWGNDFWLCGPESTPGQSAGGKWVLRARNDRIDFVKVILEQAKHASKYDQVQRLWTFYWQLLLNDLSRFGDYDTIYDLHIEPLDVTSLAPKPEPFDPRQVDRIFV